VSATLRPFAAADPVADPVADLGAAQALTAGFGWPHRPEHRAFTARHGPGILPCCSR